MPLRSLLTVRLDLAFPSFREAPSLSSVPPSLRLTVRSMGEMQSAQLTVGKRGGEKRSAGGWGKGGFSSQTGSSPTKTKDISS